MINISSPFDSALGTVTQSPSASGSGPGAVPGPPADWPLHQVQGELGTTGATWDSPFNEGLVQSTHIVTSADPGGSAPMESPFKDAIAKA